MCGLAGVRAVGTLIGAEPGLYNLTARIRTASVSILAIALLGWFLRGANLADVWRHVRTARPGLLLLALVFVAATFWIRTFR